jgi:hypothetical protein
MTAGPSPSSPRIDLDAAARLVDTLERDLAQARLEHGDAARVEKLRTDVEQLRAALAAEPPHEEVRAGLHAVRASLHAVSDELQVDAFRVSDYIARIGRLLGL